MLQKSDRSGNQSECSFSLWASVPYNNLQLKSSEMRNADYIFNVSVGLYLYTNTCSRPANAREFERKEFAAKREVVGEMNKLGAILAFMKTGSICSKFILNRSENRGTVPAE